MNYLLLFTSALCNSGRSLLLKSASGQMNTQGRFWFSQMLSFSVVMAVTFVLGFSTFREIEGITVLLGILYGLAAAVAQLCYTHALKRGSAGICALLNSFNFIPPTLAGVMIYKDAFTVFKALGIILVIPSIVLTVKLDGEGGKGGRGFVPPLLLAPCLYGSIGILQKVQQNSPAASQTSAFLFIGFLTAFLFSAVMVLVSRKREKQSVILPKREILLSLIAGVLSVVINLVNTSLAGRMSSAVLFPMVQITVILSSLLGGFLFFKEKLNRKNGFAFLFGLLAILILNL